MSEQANYLDTFPSWLKSLGDDAAALGALLEEPTLAEPAREAVAGGLNYLFKSLDLIPDGIDDIGYLDDAFVLRVAAEFAVAEDLGEVSDEALGPLRRLADEAEQVKAFLEADYSRLETYVKGLKRQAARGRMVADIVNDPEVRAEMVADVSGFAKSYEAPSFAREEKNLIKLRAFFSAKLPK